MHIHYTYAYISTVAEKYNICNTFYNIFVSFNYMYFHSTIDISYIFQYFNITDISIYELKLPFFCPLYNCDNEENS